MFIVLRADTCCRVAAGSDAVWRGSITSPDVTTFSASVHKISGSMKYLKHVSLCYINIFNSQTELLSVYTDVKSTKTMSFHLL